MFGVKSVGRIKIIAKSHLLGSTLPIFTIFIIAVSAIAVSGDFSFLVSYILNLPLINNLISTGEARSIVKIILSVIGIIITIIVIPPVKLGIERWFFVRAKGENAKVRDLFYFFEFSRFLRSQSAFWYSTAIKTAVFFFFQFPALCIFGVLYSAAFQGESSYTIVLALMVSGVMLALAGLGFYFVYSADWFMYYYIIVSNDTIKLSKAYRFSVKLVKNSIGRVCLFKLSFFPWWLLCVFVFPIFYVWGYYKQSLAVLAYRNEYLK